MALDLVSTPFTETGPPPSKRRRLGWDVPDPTLLAEVARLQLHIASQLLQVCPSLFSTQKEQTVNESGLKDDGVDTQKICKTVHRGGGRHSGASACSPPWHTDDKDGHFNYCLGDSLTPRYTILQKMGEGTFGRVLECWDHDAQEVVAIKVVRSSEKYREEAMIEVDVLHTLAEKDRTGSRFLRNLDRVCMIFYGRMITAHFLLTLSGTLDASFWNRSHGKVLFQTHENLEHLAMMERVLGPFPTHVTRRSTGKALKYFRRERTLDWPDRHTSKESIRAVHRLPTLRDLVMGHTGRSVGSLVDLLERMLHFDPSERLTAKEALKHPFFQEVFGR